MIIAEAFSAYAPGFAGRAGRERATGETDTTHLIELAGKRSHVPMRYGGTGYHPVHRRDASLR